MQMTLDRLERQYLQLVPADKLRFVNLANLAASETQQALYDRLFATGEQTFPPPKNYTTQVLKRLISQLQDIITGEEEINEDILTLYTELLATPKKSAIEDAQTATYVTYVIPSFQSEVNTRITLLEQRAVIATHGHTGARTWEAALALGEYFLSKQNMSAQRSEVLLKNKNVLELGAGSGFLSFLAARLGAAHVLATDGDTAVCENIVKNCALNRDIEEKVKMQKLVWGEPKGIASPDWHVVLAADVTYDTRVIPALVHTIKILLSQKLDSCAIIAATVRNPATLSFWEHECGKYENTKQCKEAKTSRIE